MHILHYERNSNLRIRSDGLKISDWIVSDFQQLILCGWHKYLFPLTEKKPLTEMKKGQEFEISLKENWSKVKKNNLPAIYF